jgi:hypothetical protein
MVRDGKLTNREPGLMIYYRNDITDFPTGPPTADPPVPQDITLAASNGTVWRSDTSGNLCSHCHHNVNLTEELRDPFQDVSQAPVLEWTGEANYVSDGVNPDSGPGAGSFYFRISYRDANNEAPTAIEVWIDFNDDGDYGDPGEKLALTEVDGDDVNYADGKIYSRTEILSKAGDNILNYRFYGSDGTADATGLPTSDNSVTVINAIPTLDWTGEADFVSDGVNPDIGGNGASFEFRVSYTDVEDEAPTTIQVWVDRNDDGDYLDSNEKENLTETDVLDTTYNDGKFYAFSTNISYAGDGSLNYRFYATDGLDTATGAPSADSSFTVLSSSNNPPSLQWATAACLTDGVRPGLGAGPDAGRSRTESQTVSAKTIWNAKTSRT